jgi:hypothetical protein
LVTTDCGLLAVAAAAADTAAAAAAYVFVRELKKTAKAASKQDSDRVSTFSNSLN